MTEDGPYNVNVTAGHRVSVHCRTDATPPADVTWYHNGHALNRTYPHPSTRSTDERAGWAQTPADPHYEAWSQLALSRS